MGDGLSLPRFLFTADCRCEAKDSAEIFRPEKNRSRWSDPDLSQINANRVAQMNRACSGQGRQVRRYNGSVICHAMYLAERMANDREVAYKNAVGGTSAWKFSSVGRVVGVESDEIGEGAEIFFRFLQRSEVDSLHAPFED